jgi:16S rRNA (cytidine1402-2'-O)-methyltransferase
MPAISDPGNRLIGAAVEAGVEVDVAPGPTAAVVALVLSGLPTDRFVFEGFIPRHGPARTQRLAEVAREQRTVVIYEAPHRLVRTLAELIEICGGDRLAVVARELTKMYQDVQRGNLESLHQHFFDEPPKGEFVIVIEPSSSIQTVISDEDLIHLLQAERAGGVSTRDTVAKVATITGASKRRVYELANALD